MSGRWLWVVPVVDVARARAFFDGFKVDPVDVLIVDNTREGLPTKTGKRRGRGPWPDNGTRAPERIHTGLNHGCARSWNIGVRKMQAEGRAGVVLVSPSVVWGRNGGRDLEAHLNEQHDGPVLFCRPLGWHCVAWRADVFDDVGFFDERLYPVYFEDNDWLRRTDLAGYGLHNTDELEAPYVTVDAAMGATAQSVPHVDGFLDLGHLEQYYIAKWGWPNNEHLATPFGLDVPVSWWPGNEWAGNVGNPARRS